MASSKICGPVQTAVAPAASAVPHALSGSCPAPADARTLYAASHAQETDAPCGQHQGAVSQPKSNICQFIDLNLIEYK